MTLPNGLFRLMKKERYDLCGGEYFPTSQTITHYLLFRPFDKILYSSNT